ncbi:uncharacterized protein LOC123266740 [Cotesia glomerata]|uniref:Uncharacterized protein n=1 Tax=Cotesia glomerata TaxID=32391 RepID=A0AAV7J9Y5_COTGL|nr:uncharacterized protein LOC123266740 [Cotesia glomerata]KAH0569212.1 hypothetical protein KQX54_021929 [Cotesia glomerata]
MFAHHLVIFVCIQLLLSSVSAISFTEIDNAGTDCEDIYIKSSDKEQGEVDYFVCVFRKLKAFNSDNSLNVEVIKNVLTIIGQYSPPGFSKSRFEAVFNAIGSCSSTASNTVEESVKTYFQCVKKLT